MEYLPSAIYFPFTVPSELGLQCLQMLFVPMFKEMGIHSREATLPFSFLAVLKNVQEKLL